MQGYEYSMVEQFRNQLPYKNRTVSGASFPLCILNLFKVTAQKNSLGRILYNAMKLQSYIYPAEEIWNMLFFYFPKLILASIQSVSLLFWQSDLNTFFPVNKNNEIYLNVTYIYIYIKIKIRLRLKWSRNHTLPAAEGECSCFSDVNVQLLTDILLFLR